PAGPTGLGQSSGGLPPGTATSPWNPQGDSSCCGPIGGHGPIGSELYLGAGVNMLIGGGLLNNQMKTGWGDFPGAKTPFFNPEGGRAWVVDLGVSYTNNNARIAAQDQPIFFFGVPVTLAAMSRTNFNFSLGRDYWVYTAAYVGGDPGMNIRLGADVGGRW